MDELKKCAGKGGQDNKRKSYSKMSGKKKTLAHKKIQPISRSGVTNRPIQHKPLSAQAGNGLFGVTAALDPEILYISHALLVKMFDWGFQFLEWAFVFFPPSRVPFREKKNVKQ